MHRGCCALFRCGFVLKDLFNLWISNYIHYKVYDEMTYPFPNSNGATVEVWEWIDNFISHFTGHVITSPYYD